MFLGEGGKKFGLPCHIVMHRDHDRWFDLLDHFDDVVKTEIGHSVDRHHDHVDVLQHLHLFRGQQMTNVSQVGKTQTAHLVDKNRIGDRAPIFTALTRDIDNRDVLNAGADRIPGLLEGDAAENDGIARHRPGIVVRKVVIANGHCVGLNAWRHVEIGIGDDLGLTPDWIKKLECPYQLTK